MKRLVFFTFVISLSFTIRSEDRPKWIADVKKEKTCKKKNLCAVGAGPSVNFAKRDARAALAKIFETKITSKFKSKLSDSGHSATEELEESVDAALSGSSILKIYEGKTDVYALAAINKLKASKGFKREISRIDEQMKSLVSEKTIRSARTLEKLYFKRELLHKRYEFISGRNIPGSVKYEEILKGKKILENVVAHVNLNETEPKEIESLLISLLTDMGMRATTGDNGNKKSTHIITGSISAEKLYMKVKGFEKFKFVLYISAKKMSKVETGALNFSYVASGRNYSQCYDKVLPELKEYLINNIDNLNIE